MAATEDLDNLIEIASKVALVDAPAGSGELAVRNAYASLLSAFRPGDRLVRREAGYSMSRRRADMRTVDTTNTLSEWEFKLFAGPEALGQILTYVALARRERRMEKRVRGIIAAFAFAEELPFVVEQLNLGVELVTIPPLLKWGGLCSPETTQASLIIPPLILH